MLSGRCHCGAVQFEATGDITELSHCHCSMCRRLHGAAFVSFAGVSRSTFSWTQGEDRLRKYHSSKRTDRLSCDSCGSQLGCVLKSDPESIYLAMGVIDGNPATPPAFHQFVGSRVEWCTIDDGLPQYEAAVPVQE